MPAVISCARDPETLVIGIHENLILKEHRSRAKATLEQLIELIGQRVRVATELRIIPGGTRKALENTADALRRGDVHVVALTGLEYGWLRELAGRDNEALAVANTNKNIIQYERVIVRANSDTNLAGLRGATLAMVDGPHPSMRVYLKQLQRRWGPSFLSTHTGPYSAAAKAVQAVLAGEADAAIVDLYTTQSYERAFPGQMKQLKIIAWSNPYPLAPVVGIPRVVNSIRPELWRDLRTEMTRIHAQPRAAAFMDVWRISRFNIPPDTYDGDAAQSAKDFSIVDLDL